MLSKTAKGLTEPLTASDSLSAGFESPAWSPDSTSAAEARAAAAAIFIEQGKYCANPMALDRLTTRYRDGKILPYQEPTRFHIDCGNRRANICPKCSARYKGDAQRVIQEGITTIDSPEAETFFVTLTAPGSDVLATPRDTMLFNFGFSRLWNQTVTVWRRRIPRLARLDYVRVSEHQKRGALHIHAIVVLVFEEDTETETRPSTRDVKTMLLSVLPYTANEQTRRDQHGWATPAYASRQSALDPTFELHWGTHRAKKVQHFNTSTPESRWKLSRYLAKYVTKDVTDEQSHPITNRRDLQEAAIEFLTPKVEGRIRRKYKERWLRLHESGLLAVLRDDFHNTLFDGEVGTWDDDELFPSDPEYAATFLTYLETNVPATVERLSRDLGRDGRPIVTKSHYWPVTFGDLRERRKAYAREYVASTLDAFDTEGEHTCDDGTVLAVEISYSFIGMEDGPTVAEWELFGTVPVAAVAPPIGAGSSP